MQLIIHIRSEFVDCSNSIEYTCSCNPNSFFCANHYIRHMKIPGIHREINIFERNREVPIKAVAAAEFIDADNLKIIESGEKLVKNIKSSFIDINKQVDERKQIIFNNINSNTLDDRTEKLIEDSVTAKYKIKGEVKESATEFFDMFQDQPTAKSNRTPTTEGETITKTNKSNCYKNICCLMVICILIVWLSVISFYVFNTDDKIESKNEDKTEPRNNALIKLENQILKLNEKIQDLNYTLEQYGIQLRDFASDFSSLQQNQRCSSSNDIYIISGAMDNTIRIWNLLEKTQEAVLEGHTNAVVSVVVSCDNKYIISGACDNTIRIWNILEQKQEAVLVGHTDWVYSVAISSDKKYIVSGSRDSSIRIWNFLDRTLNGVLLGHSWIVRCVVITADNKYIVSGSLDNTIRIWNLLEKNKKLFWKDILIM